VFIRNPIDTRLAPDEGIVPMTERKHVLWIGRADRDCKRADLCLQLAAECPEVPFLAVMNPQDSATELQLLASRPPNVTILPRIPWRQTDRLYRHALALLNTSESEGFPNAFLQAAKFGVPILSRRVNPDQVLTEHGIGFVAQDDLSRLAQMLRQLHATPERFSWVSRAGRRYVERYHALESRIGELHRALGLGLVAGISSQRRAG
jgi:glycosyltransferase involved in cell wall biosynthesis